jgi:nucleoside-diphosphate-sugar epimerase
VTNALVTGGSGYFGTTLIQRLLDDGVRVRNFDLNPPTGPTAGVEFMQGDIRDLVLVAKACDGIDVVFHNVAHQPVSKDPDLMESVNVGGMRTLLEAAEATGIRKVVHTSSAAVYGRTPPRVESAALAPVEPYGRAKARAEELCRDAIAGGLDVTIVRPQAVVGHGRLGIFEILFDWIAAGDPVFVFGRGDNRFQFVHAGDLADACLLAANRPGPASYNLGAADFGTMREAFEGLVAHAGTGSRIASIPTRPARLAMGALGRLGLAPFGPYHWLLFGEEQWVDITKAREELGWQPRESNHSMLCEAYDWYLANRDTLDGEGRSLHQTPTKQGALQAVRRVARVILRPRPR